MSQIVLSAEQLQIVAEALGPVEIRDPRGNLLARIESPNQAAAIEEAKCRLASDQPRFSGDQVRAHLGSLAIAVERDGLDEAQSLRLLERLQKEATAR